MGKGYIVVMVMNEKEQKRKCRRESSPERQQGHQNQHLTPKDTLNSIWLLRYTCLIKENISPIKKS